MPVSIKGTGGGSVTLSAAAAATDTTLTLPNTTGTVALVDGSGNQTVNGNLTVNGTSTLTGNVTTAGTVAMASSFKRNILINGNYLINQRGYVSGTATASGTYMHDRWKSTTTNSNYTFTQGTPDTTITIAAGTIAQIVETVNVAGGVYTLSWTGTATARIAINGGTTSGAYAASPITTSSATAGQTITVEFSTGTLGKVQLEPGTIATLYERQIYSDQLAQCQRYYYQTTPSFCTLYGFANGTGWVGSLVKFPITMRVTPTTAVVGTFTATNASGVNLAGVSPDGFTLYTQANSTGNLILNPPASGPGITASAEL